MTGFSPVTYERAAQSCRRWGHCYRRWLTPTGPRQLCTICGLTWPEGEEPQPQPVLSAIHDKTCVWEGR